MLECPHFNGTDFREWWSKLKQFFTAEGVPDGDKVRTVMLYLERCTLDWHHFYAQKHGGLPLLD